MPGYATLGLLAPLLVLVGRLVQGLSAGVEVGGVSVYLSEIATPGRKGFYVSWQSASQQMAVVFTALLGLALSRMLSRQELLAWGWRVPLLIGGLLVPVIYMIRRSLPESREFLALRRRPSFSETLRSLTANGRVVALGTMVATMTTVSFYLITAYTPTFGSVVLKLDATDTLLVTLCIGVSNFVLLPVMGALSDKIGRRPQLIACSLLALATAYPALSWLVVDPSYGRLLAVELWLSIVYAGYNGAMIVYLTEIMPASVRTTGFSLAYSLATAVFGGFTPAICTYLIHATGNRAMPGVWLSAAAVVGLVAVLALSSRGADVPSPSATRTGDQLAPEAASETAGA
jgi:MFS family permease